MSKSYATLILMVATLVCFNAVCLYEAIHHLSVGTSTCFAKAIR